MKRAIKDLIWIALWLSMFNQQCECLFKFPGQIKHDLTPKEEDEIFTETMTKMLQPGEMCNQNENAAFLTTIADELSMPKSIKEVKDTFLGGKKLCRYDLTSCINKCECNVNAAFEEKSKECRIRIGWPCTDGEVDRPNQCVSYASCKPWEGSYSYDTEMFPKATDFLADGGKYWCRCNDPKDPECGGAGDALDKVRSKDSSDRIALSSTFFLAFSAAWVFW